MAFTLVFSVEIIEAVTNDFLQILYSNQYNVFKC